jgi:hypothetical protein
MLRQPGACGEHRGSQSNSLGLNGVPTMLINPFRFSDDVNRVRAAKKGKLEMVFRL